jgi:hypothetical protein
MALGIILSDELFCVTFPSGNRLYS